LVFFVWLLGVVGVFFFAVFGVCFMSYGTKPSALPAHKANQGGLGNVPKSSYNHMQL